MTRKLPTATSVFYADLTQPLPRSTRYDVVTTFKPATGPLGSKMEIVLANLVAVLSPAGYLLVVLAEDDRAGYVRNFLDGLGMSVLTCDHNALSSRLERDHKWVVLCKAPDGA